MHSSKNWISMERVALLVRVNGWKPKVDCMQNSIYCLNMPNNTWATCGPDMAQTGPPRSRGMWAGWCWMGSGCVSDVSAGPQLAPSNSAIREILQIDSQVVSRTDVGSKIHMSWFKKKKEKNILKQGQTLEKKLPRTDLFAPNRCLHFLVNQCILRT